MSQLHYSPLNAIISKSEFENPKDTILQSPEDLCSYLQFKIPLNPPLIQEISTLLSMILPKGNRKTSMENLMIQLANCDNSQDPKICISQQKTENCEEKHNLLDNILEEKIEFSEQKVGFSEQKEGFSEQKIGPSEQKMWLSDKLKVERSEQQKVELSEQELEDLEEKTQIPSHKPTKNEILEKTFSDHNLAGFLLIIFALKNDYQEMALFLAKEFPDLVKDFLDSLKDFMLIDICKVIYQGLYDFYKGSEEKFYMKMLGFLRHRPGIVVLKREFFRLVTFTLKTANSELIDCLLESFPDINEFLNRKNGVFENEKQFFDRILMKILNEIKNQRYKASNEEKVLTRFSIKCLENSWESLFRLIVKFRPLLLDNMRLFKSSLSYKNLETLKNFMKINENAKEFLLNEENFSKLLDFLENEANFLDGIFLLNEIKSEPLDIFYQRFLIMKFETLLSSTNKSQLSLYRILLSHVNPFSLCVVLSDIFHEIAMNSKELKLKFDFLAVKFKDLALSIFERLQNSVNLRLLLTKTFFPAKTSILELLLKKCEFFEKILIKPNVYSLINEIWDSPYENSCNLLRFSTGFCFISGKMAIFPDMDLNSSGLSFSMEKSSVSASLSPSDSPKRLSQSSSTLNAVNSLKSIITFNSDGFSMGKANLFKYMKTAESLNLKMNFNYQLKVFMKCMGFRYFIEFLSFFTAFGVILTILMQNLETIFAANEAPDVMEGVLNFMIIYSSETNDTLLVEKLLSFFPENQQSNFLTFFSTANQDDSLTFICKTALYMFSQTMEVDETLFNTETAQCVDIVANFENYFDQVNDNIAKEILLIMTCFTGVLQVLYYFFKTKKLSFSFQHIIDFLIITFTSALLYYNTISNNQTYFLNNFDSLLQDMKIALIALVLLTFIKIIIFLRMTTCLGVPLRILFKMMSHLSTIIIMFILIFTTFTIFMYFLFITKDEQYNTLLSSFETIFKFIFGEMAYYQGDDPTMDYSYFSVLTIGLVFIRIIFLNILIAILSNIYERIQEKSGLEISLMIHEYNKFQDHKEKTMNSLVLLPSPFNIVSLLLSPWILYKRDKKTNEIVLKMGYCCLLAVLVIFFLLAHIVILPLAWLLVFWRLLTNTYGEDYEVSRIRFSIRIGHMIQWLLIGPLYLIYVIFKYDLMSFLKKAFDDIYEPSKSDEFTLEEYKILKKVVRMYLEINHEKTIKIEVFWKKFQRMFENLKQYEEIKNDDFKKDEELLVLMKNNFENLTVGKEIKVEMIEKLLKNIKKMKIVKTDGNVVKYPQFMDIVNLQIVGDTIKLFQYKNQLLK